MELEAGVVLIHLEAVLLNDLGRIVCFEEEAEGKFRLLIEHAVPVDKNIYSGSETKCVSLYAM